ncbi:hypothetical protein RBS60_19140 [Sinomonas sp. ASV486]|uniref:hypothetical protein n=1 Tax=Sinomonas sp. ASV486 TaxID=3051170 RepID=UPI0027DB60C1|nr:hypothetical protein [Sinomonas sp. ASV486]MDQ4492318.1 hypothetical protein [Sinomonas sp. ASV486]
MTAILPPSTVSAARAPQLRTYAGAASLGLFFITSFATQFLFSDGGPDTAATLRVIAAGPGTAIAWGWIMLALAALWLGGVLFLAGATRGRGSGWGAAGTLAGILGTVGITLIGMHALTAAALAQTPLDGAAATLQALDGAAGWFIFPLMTCQMLAVALFALSLWRQGTVHRWVAAAGCAAVVVSALPWTFSGPAALGLGLASLGVGTGAVIRLRRAAGWVEAPAQAYRVWAGAACAVGLLVLSILKDALFAGADDPDAALAAVGSHPVPLVVEGVMALGVAALFAGTTAFFVGSVRGRGSGLAAAGGVLGIVGSVSIASMGALDFLTAALGVSGAGTGVFGPLAGILFPAFMPLFLAENLMLVAFAAALWRSGVTAWVPFALSLVFAAVAQVHPVGPVALAQMALGLVVAGWLAYRILRSRGLWPRRVD